ncbi:hypothetical protein TrRE_jg8900, partial [Triparma retinervis]
MAIEDFWDAVEEAGWDCVRDKLGDGHHYYYSPSSYPDAASVDFTQKHKSYWEEEIIDSDDELDSFTLTSSVRTFTFNVVWHFIQCRGWKWVSAASIKDKASLPSSVIKGANVYVAPPSDGGGIFADGNDVVNYLDGEGQGVALRREFLKSVF